MLNLSVICVCSWVLSLPCLNWDNFFPFLITYPRTCSGLWNHKLQILDDSLPVRVHRSAWLPNSGQVASVTCASSCLISLCHYFSSCSCWAYPLGRASSSEGWVSWDPWSLLGRAWFGLRALRRVRCSVPRRLLEAAVSCLGSSSDRLLCYVTSWSQCATTHLEARLMPFEWRQIRWLWVGSRSTLLAEFKRGVAAAGRRLHLGWSVLLSEVHLLDLSRVAWHNVPYCLWVALTPLGSIPESLEASNDAPYEVFLERAHGFTHQVMSRLARVRLSSFEIVVTRCWWSHRFSGNQFRNQGPLSAHFSLADPFSLS